MVFDHGTLRRRSHFRVSKRRSLRKVHVVGGSTGKHIHRDVDGIPRSRVSKDLRVSLTELNPDWQATGRFKRDPPEDGAVAIYTPFISSETLISNPFARTSSKGRQTFFLPFSISDRCPRSMPNRYAI